MDSPAVPDELLVEIFLRIAAADDLVRASAACVSFGRLIADRPFLRRYSRLHAPPFLGFFDTKKVFHPAEPPHSSASAASAIALAADLSIAFLPGPSGDYWVKDVCGGRVLLDRSTYDDCSLVVCDPLHRRYLMLPPTPDDLAREDLLLLSPRNWYDTFLVPPGDNDDEAVAAEEETSFRVIWMAQYGIKMFTFIFSSVTGQWRAVPSQSWSDLSAGLLGPTEIVDPFNGRQYACGCFYWLIKLKEEWKMLVLDIQRLEFSIVEPPPEAKGGFIPNMTMVETREGMTGVFTLVCGSYNLHYSISRSSSASSSHWQSVKTIPLKNISPHAPRYSLISSLGSYLFLYYYGSSSLDPGFFTLDIETFQLEKVCAVDMRPHAYSNFPPSLLSSPTI